MPTEKSEFLILEYLQHLRHRDVWVANNHFLIEGVRFVSQAVDISVRLVGLAIAPEHDRGWCGTIADQFLGVEAAELFEAPAQVLRGNLRVEGVVTAVAEPNVTVSRNKMTRRVQAAVGAELADEEVVDLLDLVAVQELCSADALLEAEGNTSFRRLTFLTRGRNGARTSRDNGRAVEEQIAQQAYYVANVPAVIPVRVTVFEALLQLLRTGELGGQSISTGAGALTKR